ncbi:MAG TPA: hypothetical protein VGF67_21405 [Ktedonobacteraceae bacterium]|jgi:hypothetical protein
MVLAHPDFRSLWTGRNLSRLGDSLYEVAPGWTVYTITGSSAAMGLVLASTTVLLADAGAALITGGLALLIASGHASLCLLVSACAGHRPAAKQNGPPGPTACGQRARQRHL